MTINAGRQAYGEDTVGRDAQGLLSNFNHHHKSIRISCGSERTEILFETKYRTYDEKFKRQNIKIVRARPISLGGRL